MEQEPHILFEKRGAVGLITLNRPKALNALTHGMCLGLLKMLPEWAADDAIKGGCDPRRRPQSFLRRRRYPLHV